MSILHYNIQLPGSSLFPIGHWRYLHGSIYTTHRGRLDRSHDIVPLLLIGVPILHPIAASLGLSSLWFALLVVLVINLGLLTLPVGLILFVFRGDGKKYIYGNYL
jgi:hypothetical protein